MLQVTVNQGARGTEGQTAQTNPGERRPLQQDLSLAIAVQRQMLPRSPKQLATLRYAGLSTAALGVGGDYYDFPDLGAGRLGIVLGDVSGKGVAAALLMANLQASIRCECAHGSGGLRALLQRVNAQFAASSLPQQYATLFFGRYDDRLRRLDYINCGQQPAIVMRRDHAVQRLDTTALPVGLVKDWDGEEQSVELERGDVLCICSDGVVEAGIESACEFGEDGLTSVLATNPDEDIEAAVARIAQAAMGYGPADDMTVIAAQSV